MAMTTLQTMAVKDATARLILEDRQTYDRYVKTISNAVLSDGPTSIVFEVLTDQQIKENGYEGAVEQVYQQMVQLGQPA